jgi:hypothetical protein
MCVSQGQKLQGLRCLKQKTRITDIFSRSLFNENIGLYRSGKIGFAQKRVFSAIYKIVSS